MKQMMIMAATLSFFLTAVAAGDMLGNVTGEVTKVEGEMVTIKTADGANRTVHVDPKSTRTEGDISTGAYVTADVTSDNRAIWIKITPNEPMRKMKTDTR